MRWNSTYYMIRRLQEQSWPITACLSDPGITKGSKHYLDLKPVQWSLLEELERALKPFECATVYLSGESYVTLSSLPLLINGLLKSAQTTSSFENPHILVFQKAAENEITERWQNELEFTEATHNTSLIASALDPRCHRLKFLSADDILRMQGKILHLALEEKQKSDAVVQQHITSRSSADTSEKVSVSMLEALLASDDSDKSSHQMDREETDDMHSV